MVAYSYTGENVQRTTFGFVTDPRGSVRMVVRLEDGAVAQRLDYGPFGEVILDTNPGFQPFGYAGGIYDADTGLVRFGARDYDAETGRWLTRDPVGFAAGDANLFAYVGGDPVNSADPTGLQECCDQECSIANEGWPPRDGSGCGALEGSGACSVTYCDPVRGCEPSEAPTQMPCEQTADAGASGFCYDYLPEFFTPVDPSQNYSSDEPDEYFSPALPTPVTTDDWPPPDEW